MPLASKYGISLNCFGAATPDEMSERLNECRTLGVSFCEAFRTGDSIPLKLLAEIAEKARVPICSYHVNIESFDSNYLLQIKDTLNTHGVSRIICSGESETFPETVRQLTSLNDSLRSHCPKLSLNYHLFDSAFEEDDSGQSVLSALLKQDGLHEMGFVVDTFWATMANIPPIEVLKRLDSRCNYVHLKDCCFSDKNNLKYSDYTFVALGRGDIEIGDTLNWMARSHSEYIPVIEFDVLEPSLPITKQLRTAVDFIQNRQI